MQFARKQ